MEIDQSKDFIIFIAVSWIMNFSIPRTQSQVIIQSKCEVHRNMSLYLVPVDEFQTST